MMCENVPCLSNKSCLGRSGPQQVLHEGVGWDDVDEEADDGDGDGAAYDLDAEEEEPGGIPDAMRNWALGVQPGGQVQWSSLRDRFIFLPAAVHSH